MTVDWLLGRTDARVAHAADPTRPPCAAQIGGNAEPACRFPEALPGEVAALSARLQAMESQLHTIAAQMETITGLLSGALRAGIEHPPAHNHQKKAG